MWQRFTERARKCVFYAQDEAQKYGEGYVSTEHLLLGLLRETDNVAYRVIVALGVNPARVVAEVERQLPRNDAKPSQDMTLTPRAKRVIDLAYDEARNLNNNYIGTEHMLLGLIREADGLAGRVLDKLGIELEKARREVISIQDNEASSPAPPPSPRVSHSVHSDWPGETQTYNPAPYLHFRQGRHVADHLFLLLTAAEEGEARKLAEIAIADLSGVIRWIEITLSKGMTPGDPDDAGTVMDRILARANEAAQGPVKPRHLLLAIAEEEASLAGTILKASLERLTQATYELDDEPPTPNP